MSDTLTPETPVEDPAASAPEPEPAASSDSVNSEDVIPKERFNGLQSKYQADKAAWDVERAAFLSQIESAQQAEVEQPDVSDDVMQELKALRAELAKQAFKSARADAVAKYPGAAPLADLIVGNTAEEIDATASMLQDRLTALLTPTGSGEPAGSENESAAPPVVEAPAAPQHGGGASFDSSATTDDRIGAAIEAKDFSAFLSAAAERAELQGNTDLTVG